MSDATEVIQIDGAPGAGKTYTLRQRLEEEAADGLGLSDFYWLNFTNSGREDVEPEIADVYAGDDLPVEPQKRAKTFHGLALSLAIRDGMVDPEVFDTQILQQGGATGGSYDPYVHFCKQQGITYDPHAADPKKLLSGVANESHIGNVLFAINDYLTSTCKPAEKWESAPADIPLSGDTVPTLLEKWDSYKRDPPVYDFRLFEHGDYVEAVADAALTPAVDVLFIDEFQDLAPLEYRLFKLWRDAGDIDRIYIAGDSNQSIYSFRGATPYYFEETATDDRVLLQDSRRCPEAIASVARAVLSTHEQTDPRGFGGFEKGGKTRWESFSSKSDLRTAAIDATDAYAATPSAMMLTRTNRQLGELTSDLRDVGVPFEILGQRRGIWRDDMADLLEVLNGIQTATTYYQRDAVKTLLKTLPGDAPRLPTGVGGIIDADAVNEGVFAGYDSPLDIIGRLQLPSWKREVLANAVDAPASMNPGEVAVGTVHTAKGLEAPAVYLFTASSESMLTRYDKSPDLAAEEHRVYYVGATRASEELHLVDDYFEGPIAPPLQKVRNTGAIA
jgi:superfamily I DNA/RNA helicase